ncbi:MAG TPA: hypothetical protein VLM91_04995 [Candidatus Methylomirabilis sp.]|nr:hypothetical protein [Candidatus Methylomirabilis sp.]
MGKLGVKCGLVWGIVLVVLAMAPFSPRMSSAGSAVPPDPQDALHEVVSGDNLHLVAGYYYGDGRQWERIWHANRGQVPNPNRLELGMVLRIPDVTSPAEPYADFVARVRRSPVPGGNSGRP